MSLLLVDCVLPSVSAASGARRACMIAAPHGNNLQPAYLDQVQITLAKQYLFEHCV